MQASRDREIAEERAGRPTAAASLGYGSAAGLAARADVCSRFLRDSAAGNGPPLDVLRAAWAKAKVTDRKIFLAEIGQPNVR
jgi:hypothetical protein